MGTERALSGRILGAGCAAILASVLLDGAGARAEAAGISVERGPREHAARTRVGDCVVALEHRLEWDALTYRNRCAQSLDEKGRLLDALLSALFGASRLPEEISSVGLGRMIQLSEALSQRMALDAHADPGWAEVLRRHVGRDPGSYGLPNQWVTDWLDETRAFDPLAAPLRARGVRPRAGTVEKVLITPPAPTALGAWLVERGVPADAHVPFDAQLWLVLEHAARSADSRAGLPPVASDASPRDDAMRELEACLRRSHVEQCVARLPTDDGGPCDPRAAPIPVVRAAPRYSGPPAESGARGFVELEARISPAGAPRDPRVVASEPAGVFDAEAVRALKRWRYCPDAHRGKSIRVRMAFPPGS